MPQAAIQPGAAFRFFAEYLEDDIFLFDHCCTIKRHEGLYRRFNRVGGFITPNGIASLSTNALKVHGMSNI